MKHYFFQNRAPRTKVYLSGVGVWAAFDQINDDIATLITRRDDVAKDLQSLSKNPQTTVDEITEEEWQALQKKRRPLTSPKDSREVITNPSKRPTRTPLRPKITQQDIERAEAVDPVRVQELRAKMEQSPLPQEHRPTAAPAPND